MKLKFGEQARLQNVLDTIEYKDWRFRLEKHDGKFWLNASGWFKDATGESEFIERTSFSTFDPGLSKAEFIQQIRRTIKQGEEHEVDEWFTVDGGRPFNPHRTSR